MIDTALTHSPASRPHSGASIPIADYGLLADCNSAALVSRDGSIDWLCLPRYDSDAIFARILGDAAGHWSLRPAGEYAVERRYVPGTLVIETTFTTGTGVVRMRDAMAFAPGQRGHDLGYDAPHEVLRSVEGVSGEVELVLELAARTEYGLVQPLFRQEGDGGRTFGGPNRITVRAGVPVEVEDATMRAAFTVRAGDRVGFSLRWAPPEARDVPEPAAPDAVAARLADTVEAWRSWEADHDVYDGPHRELVRLSSRVLKGLTYRPTGAIVAAPTTSLPETVGGARNWDYRYAWIRDASLTLEALYIGSCTDEAEEFVSFMTSSAGGGAALQIMYGIRGEHDLTERELPHLRGWRDSSPVRVGNGAWSQTQLDVYGELLDALHLYREQLGELHPEIQEFAARLADAAAERDRVREAILERGWSQARGAYTQSFESEELDAAALVMPIVGFLPATDERMRSTIEAIARELSEGGLVLRYRNEVGLNADGLEGEEGTFVICSFWLVSCLAKAGEHPRAEQLFDRLAGYANDLGLLAEEIDTANDEQLGNFPQAFSHIGLITAANG